MRRPLSLLFILIVIFIVGGCSGSYKNSLEFNPGEPLRVAVLPFIHVDAHGEVDLTDPSTFIDRVPLVSSRLEDAPASYVQKLVQANFETTGLDLVSPGFVSTQLTHRGFGDPPNFIPDRIRRTTPQALCEILFCDALLYGEVTSWDRSYYGIQSASTVGIQLRLVRAKDGKMIFSSTARDSDSRGLTKGPTGISSLVLEPIRGLDNEIITDLARRMVVKMLAPLKLENRPEFLNSSPPTILASSHDSSTGQIDRSDVLTVVMLGTPQKSAAFSIGTVVENVPMNEVDDGHYVGEFYALPQDRFERQPISVSLTDEYGRMTRQDIAIGPVTLQ